MFDLSSIKTGKIFRPKIIMLYGVPGIGKTTQLAAMPNPIIIATEDGNDELDVARFPKANSYDEVKSALDTIETQEHEFLTLGFDSISSMEMLIHAKICQENGVTQIEKIPYGKGPKLAMEYWQEFWLQLERIRNNRSMTVVMTAHPEIYKVPNPEGESYDSYRPLLHKDALEIFKQNCDAIFFANFKTLVRSVDKGFGNKEHKGIGNGDRVMYTSTRPYVVAKNRMPAPGMPHEMPMDLNMALDYWQNPEKYAQQ